MDRNLPAGEPLPPPEPEDFYFEGSLMVFTEAHHLKRGFCCCSGCRHCPYGFEKPATPQIEPLSADDPAE